MSKQKELLVPDYPVGHIFKLYEKEYRVVGSDGGDDCAKCALSGNALVCDGGTCAGPRRADDRSVYFVEVSSQSCSNSEEPEDPVIEEDCSCDRQQITDCILRNTVLCDSAVVQAVTEILIDHPNKEIALDVVKSLANSGLIVKTLKADGKEIE